MSRTSRWLMAALVMAGCTSRDTPPAGAPKAPANDNIRVTAPLPGDLVASPLRIAGEARGTWYFEASFPVRLLDDGGRQLAIVPAQARGEWMTTEFVPFEVMLTFTTPVSATGSLVLQKDNPSGLPEHADSIVIPVRFR